MCHSSASGRLLFCCCCALGRIIGPSACSRYHTPVECHRATAAKCNGYAMVSLDAAFSTKCRFDHVCEPNPSALRQPNPPPPTQTLLPQSVNAHFQLYVTPLDSTPHHHTTPHHTTPHHTTPHHTTPHHSTPLHSTPLHSTPHYCLSLPTGCTLGKRSLMSGNTPFGSHDV